MNKKILLFGILPVLAICLVAAGLLTYYGQIQQDIEVQSPITVSPDTSVLIEGWAGFVGIVEGEPVTIENIAPMEVEVKISNDNVEPNIDVSYVGSLVLSHKDLSDWTLYGETKTIGYTIVGETFEVTDIPEGYTLIYYPNTEGDNFATNIANVLVYGNDEFPNLPISLDVGDDYCNNGHNPNANQCIGAKLWLIGGTESEAMAKLNSWDASEFYFETDLIQFNTEGNIVMSPGSSLIITPVYDIDSTYIGTTTITTSVEPVA